MFGKHMPGWNSITKRIVLILILLILPFNIVSIVTTMYALHNARQQTLSVMENLSALAVQQMDNRLMAMNDFFYNLDKIDSDFRLYKEQGTRNRELVMAETDLADYFNMIVENEAFADVLFWNSAQYARIYIGMDSLYNSKSDKIYNDKEKIRNFLKTAELAEYNRWGIVEIDDMTWLVRVYVYNGDFYYGSMISLDELEYNLRRSSSFENLEIVFAEEQDDPDVPDGMLCVETKSGTGHFKMQMRVPGSEGYTSLPPFQMLCIGFAFLYILLIPLLIYLIHRMILHPLKNISQAMEHLRNGEQEYRMTVHAQDADEFAAVSQTFNDMADRIRDLRIENYEKELERQRVELRNLQLQIRPHFLMNMFNLLYSFAQIENYQDIQKLALYLSEYFRYLFQSGKELQPFDRELDLIQRYVEIAGLRYPDCCEVVYEIDPEALEVEVPPLLIHNFVENIFKHVVNYDKKLHLRIEAYTDEEEATFLIADDGPGMEAQFVDAINHGTFTKSRDDRIHVGIENSYRRMKYFYGDKGSLTVESELGQGTCFSLVIPLR
ncbi:MAG: histidine kinase [Blautia sp.]|nr:histidine kinase [Blautia sp.]MCM1202429.1 histidine kinase [Bacteroides fragilis]